MSSVIVLIASLKIQIFTYSEFIPLCSLNLSPIALIFSRLLMFSYGSIIPSSSLKKCCARILQIYSELFSQQVFELARNYMLLSFKMCLHLEVVGFQLHFE